MIIFAFILCEFIDARRLLIITSGKVWAALKATGLSLQEGLRSSSVSVSRGTAPSTWKTKTPHDYHHDHDYDDHYDHYPGQGDQLGQDLMVQLLAVQQPRPGASRANLV